MEKTKREIKFRGWNPRTKEMYYQISIGSKPIDDLDEFFKKTAEDGFVWMQYTGLLDKNGKEIYCGDIVKGYFDTNEVEDYIWLSLTDEEKKNGWKLFKIDMDIVEFARQQLPDELEIVGNVMENPNLLLEKEK